MSLLTDASDRFKADLLADDVTARNRLVGVYGSAYQRLAPEVERVAQKIQRARDAGDTPSTAWLYRVGRLSQLQEQAAREMVNFGAQAEDLITAAQRQTAERGGQEAEELTRVALGEGGIDVHVPWNRVPKEALKDLVGNLSDGSPLSDLFNQYGPAAATGLKDTLTTGLVAGWNPRRIATAFREDMAQNLNRALVVARTETLRVYRESTRRSFEANSDVVDGWVWLATLTTRTCPCCWAMNGTFHGNDETLDGHPCCRCCQVPKTKSAKELGLGDETTSVADDIPLGETVFAQLSEFEQHAILGPRGYQLYSTGQVHLSDFVGRKENQAWGSMRFVLSPGQALAKALTEASGPSLAALDPEAARLRANLASKVSNLRKKLRKDGFGTDEEIEAEVRKLVPEYFKEPGPAPGIVGPGPIGPKPEPLPPVPQPSGRDELTAKWLNGKGKVSFIDLETGATPEARANIIKLSKKLFGRELTDAEWRNLAGAPDGGELFVRQSKAGTLHMGYDPEKGSPIDRLSRYIGRDSDGVLRLKNDILEMAQGETSKGLGTRVFATQVEQATKLDVKYIETLASGDPQSTRYNGYYTWARLGYDGDTTFQVREAAELAGFGRPKLVSEILSQEGGAAWWKANGTSFDGVFDLTEGARSQRILSKYLELRDIRIAEEAVAVIEPLPPPIEPVPPPIVPPPPPVVPPPPVPEPPQPPKPELSPEEAKRLKANLASKVSRMRKQLIAEGKTAEEAEAIVRKLVPEYFGGTGIINPEPVPLPPGPPPPPPVPKPPPIPQPVEHLPLERGDWNQLSGPDQMTRVREWIRAGRTVEEIRAVLPYADQWIIVSAGNAERAEAIAAAKQFVRLPGLNPLEAPSAGGSVGRRPEAVQRLWVKKGLLEGYSIEEIAHVGEIDLALAKEMEASIVKDVDAKALAKAEKASKIPKAPMTGAEARMRLTAFDPDLNDQLERAERDLAEKQELVMQAHKELTKHFRGDPGYDAAKRKLDEAMQRRGPFLDQVENLKRQLKGGGADAIAAIFPDKGEASILTNYDALYPKKTESGRQPTPSASQRQGIDAASKGLAEFKKLIGPGRIDGLTVKFGITPDNREFYRSADNTLALNKAGSKHKVIVHELGHWLETHEPEANKACQDFLARRTAGEKSITMNEATGKSVYDAHEYTKVDKFRNPYIGKQYGFSGTEVLSMGLEYMVDDAVAFAKEDPEMFDLIYDIIQGAHL